MKSNMIVWVFLAMSVLLLNGGLALAGEADTATGSKWPAGPISEVNLYQEPDIVAKRMMNDSKGLCEFIENAQTVWAKAVPDANVRSQTALVVAIGANRESRGWIVGGGVESNELNTQLTTLLQKIKVPAIKEGVVAVAVKASRFAEEPSKPDSFSPPMPQEWREAMKKANQPETTDQLIERLLPEKREKAPNRRAERIRQPEDDSEPEVVTYRVVTPEGKVSEKSVIEKRRHPTLPVDDSEYKATHLEALCAADRLVVTSRFKEDKKDSITLTGEEAAKIAAAAASAKEYRQALLDMKDCQIEFYHGEERVRVIYLQGDVFQVGNPEFNGTAPQYRDASKVLEKFYGKWADRKFRPLK